MGGELSQGSGREREKPGEEANPLDSASIEAGPVDDVQLIPTEGIKKNLSNLAALLPGRDWNTYDFSRQLAGYMPDRVTPESFLLFSELFLSDLQRGNDGKTGERITSSLARQPGFVYSFIRMDLGNIAAAACPKEFADSVAELIATFEAEVKQTAEKGAAESLAKVAKMDLKDYLAKAQAIERLIVETISGHDNSLPGDSSRETPNPFYHQVQPNGGLALIMYYGSPSKFGTPLGELRLGTGCQGTSNGAMAILKEKLGLVEIVPVKITHEGEFGPIYAITKDAEGNPLPKAELAQGLDYIKYEDAKRLWDENVPVGREDSQAVSRRYEADREILLSRGRTEPKPSADDIRTINALWDIKPAYVKFTKDKGMTWEYGKVTRFDPDYGIALNMEVRPNAQGHSALTISQKNCDSDGYVFRVASKAEVEGIKFSYQR